MKKAIILIFLTLFIFQNYGVSQPNNDDQTVEPPFGNDPPLEICHPDSYLINERPCWVIPIFIHVVHDENVPIGDPKNPSNEVLANLVEELNNDFRARNDDIIQVIPEFCEFIGDCRISFVHDADEHIQRVGIGPAPGIFPFPYSFADQIQTASPKPVGTENLLHIWITEFDDINDNLGMECPLDPEYPSYLFFSCLVDGVMVSYQSITNQSRVPTHEVGHWAGLYHPEGIGPVAGDDPYEHDDLIWDTPCQPQSITGPCDLYTLSNGNVDPGCNSTSIPPCHCVNPFEMPYANVQNFMQRSNSCRRMFTGGQCIAMNNILYEFRPEYEAIELCATTIPGIYREKDDNFNQKNKEENYTINPNPSSDIINISYSKDADFRVYNMLGELVISVSLPANQEKLTLNINHLQNGVYIVVFSDAEKIYKTQKLVKQ